MEINGVANLKMHLVALIECLTGEIQNQDVKEKVATILLKTENELDFLERYMVAYHDAMKINLESTKYYGRISSNIPAWHEIKADRFKYPTLKERVLNEKR